MNLVYDELSAAQVTFIQEHLSRLRIESPVGVENNFSVGMDDVLVTQSHSCYDGVLSNIANGMGVLAFEKTGIRSLVYQRNVLLGSVIIPSAFNESKSGSSQIQFDSGELIAATERAFAKVGNMYISNDEIYQVRVLRIPGIDINAVWLKGSGWQWYFPFSTGPGRQDLKWVYADLDFTRIIQGLARKRLGIA